MLNLSGAKVLQNVKLSLHREELFKRFNLYRESKVENH